MQRREYAIAACAFALFFVSLFSPALFRGLILGPGDGMQYWAVFRRGFLLWNERILTGFPAYADPQQLTWYPLRWLSPSFNAFVVSAYVVAATGAYVLARVYRAHPLAAAAGALVYASSGFMMAHLGHTTMIHAAAWLPWIMAAIEKQSITGSRGWRAIGAIAICMALLGGHPQVVVYGLGVGAALMGVNVVVRARADRASARALAISYGLMLVIGVALSAIQIVPSSQLANQTERAASSFEFFVTYSLPARQVGAFYFPFAWGAWQQNTPPYFGDWNFTELANFVGLSTLTFIAAGFLRIADAKKYLWLGVAVIAFVFTLGPLTPVARIAFELPLLHSFRVPGRAAILIMLAASVLLSMSLTTLCTARQRRLLPAVLALAPLVAAAATAALFLPDIQAAAAKASTAPLPVTHETYVVPMLAGVMAAGIVALVTHARLFAFAALVLVGAELAWWGVNLEWRFWAPSVPAISADVASLRDRANEVGGRIAPLEGLFKGPGALHPNMSTVFDIRSTSGYGPLLPTRYRQISGLTTSGDTPKGALNTSIFQAMGVSHVVYTPAAGGEISFARGCGGASMSATRIVLPTATRATHLRLRSNMGCAPQIEQGAPVLRIVAQGSGRLQERTLRAGIDTAEWAIRRPDVAPTARHREPAQSVEVPGTNGMGRIFVSDIPLQDSGVPTNIKSLDFELLADGVSMQLYSVELVDSTTGAVTIPPPGFPSGMRFGDFHEEGKVGGLSVARFKRFLGFAWLAPSAVAATAEQSLAALKSERTPGGAALDLGREVLIESRDPPLKAASPAAMGKVTNLLRTDGHLRFEVETSEPQYLVVAQQDYHGWRAVVNDAPAPIHRANHAFQAVVVPAGQSIVDLRFQPSNFPKSALVSLAAALALALLTFGRASARAMLRAVARMLRKG